MNGKYLTAVICKNGHVLTSTLELNNERYSKFCSECGEETITKCGTCNEKIRGIFFTNFTSWGYKIPRNCHNCGRPYIWTTRKLEIAIQYSEEIENLSEKEKEILKQSISDISSNSPIAEVAVIRYKKILKKIGGKIVGKLNDIIVDLASETIKKLLKE